jgi:hypothetical protein
MNRSQMIRKASQLPKGNPERRKLLAGLKEAATEILLSDLPAEQERIKATFQKLGLNPTYAFDGIHGYIVGFEPRGGGVRFNSDKLTAALRGTRWFEINNQGDVAVGM